MIANLREIFTEANIMKAMEGKVCYDKNVHEKQMNKIAHHPIFPLLNCIIVYSFNALLWVGLPSIVFIITHSIINNCSIHSKLK